MTTSVVKPAIEVAATSSAEGANLARRNQMKLSGKRTLSPTELWKIVQLSLNDTDGVNLVRLLEAYKTSELNQSLRSNYRGAR